ncbi:hypothetical protein C8Q75DRAFT_749507 [Abortiporus biennis]|nr:hypothetical protein C8Q75DRAFT_749507 [Abortiporus biennis]
MFLLVLLFSALQVSLAGVIRITERPVEYYDPEEHGGSWLNRAGRGGGEPLNVIISGLSSPSVLTNEGITNYARAIGFSTECLNLHFGTPQSADLGDGNGDVDQALELREDYGDPYAGTCAETAIGGNHFRVYRQNGPLANSGALFLAVSSEASLAEDHTIIDDGYNLGRDLLVNAAIGRKTFNGVSYITTNRTVYNAMSSGIEGVNHDIPIDGSAVVLTVKIIKDARHSVVSKLKYELPFFYETIIQHTFRFFFPSSSRS